MEIKEKKDKFLNEMQKKYQRNANKGIPKIKDIILDDLIKDLVNAPSKIHMVNEAGKKSVKPLAKDEEKAGIKPKSEF